MTDAPRAVAPQLWVWVTVAGVFAAFGVFEVVDGGDGLLWLLVAGVFLVAGYATRERTR